MAARKQTSASAPNPDQEARALRLSDVGDGPEPGKAFNPDSEAKGKVTIRPLWPQDRIVRGDTVIEASGTQVERSLAKELHDQGVEFEEV